MGVGYVGQPRIIAFVCQVMGPPGWQVGLLGAQSQDRKAKDGKQEPNVAF